jgi:hypothetical protein
MKTTTDITGGKPIAVFIILRHLVAFYDIHGGKREVLFFYFVPDTTRDLLMITINNKGALVRILINEVI